MRVLDKLPRALPLPNTASSSQRSGQKAMHPSDDCRAVAFDQPWTHDAECRCDPPKGDGAGGDVVRHPFEGHLFFPGPGENGPLGLKGVVWPKALHARASKSLGAGQAGRGTILARPTTQPRARSITARMPQAWPAASPSAIALLPA